MKKFTALLLSLICMLSLVACPVSASGNLFEDILEDEFGVTQDSVDETMSYGVHYEMQTLSTVSIMYKPNPDITFKAPVKVKITEDTPLSVDYQFVCWQHKDTGVRYYPGDEIIVMGKETLWAVWEEKTDNHPRAIRTIITALETLGRLIDKFLGIVEAIEETDAEYLEPTTTAAAVS